MISFLRHGRLLSIWNCSTNRIHTLSSHAHIRAYSISYMHTLFCSCWGNNLVCFLCSSGENYKLYILATREWVPWEPVSFSFTLNFFGLHHHVYVYFTHASLCVKYQEKGPFVLTEAVQRIILLLWFVDWGCFVTGETFTRWRNGC